MNNRFCCLQAALSPDHVTHVEASSLPAEVIALSPKMVPAPDVVMKPPPTLVSSVPVPQTAPAPPPAKLPDNLAVRYFRIWMSIDI